MFLHMVSGHKLNLIPKKRKENNRTCKQQINCSKSWHWKEKGKKRKPNQGLWQWFWRHSPSLATASPAKMPRTLYLRSHRLSSLRWVGWPWLFQLLSFRVHWRLGQGGIMRLVFLSTDVYFLNKLDAAHLHLIESGGRRWARDDLCTTNSKHNFFLSFWSFFFCFGQFFLKFNRKKYLFGTNELFKKKMN